MWIKSWNKLADEDDYDISTELENKSFYSFKSKFYNIINTILNIVVALACIFYFEIAIWKLPIIMIGMDFALTFISTFTVNRINKRYDKILLGYKSDKYLPLLKDKRDKYKEVCKNCTYSNCYHNNCDYENRIEHLTIVIDKIEKIIAPVEIKDVVKESNEIKQADAISGYKEKLNNIKKEKFDYLSENHKKDIKKCIKITETLLTEVEKNPSSYKIVQNTFDIYLMELINAITSVNKLDENLNKEYKDKINTLIVEYGNHVERILERVQKYSLTNIDVTINTLLKEMKNDE